MKNYGRKFESQTSDSPTIWTDEKLRWEESEKRREAKRGEAKRRKKKEEREEKRREEKRREEKRREEKGREEKRREEKRREEKRREAKGREGKGREGKRREEKRRERVRRKKMQAREKVEKLRITVFFPNICGSERSNSRLAKAADAKPSGQMRDETLHAVVARSTFPSQNVQNTSASEHF